MAYTLMFQGTGSHVGKSILVTALCRILLQDGYKPVPFKAQNMALNSYVTKDGCEMGRAQVAQAEAAGLEPDVRMNPVLLKPTGQQSSQVIVMGKAVATLSAKDYHSGYSIKALDVIERCLNELKEQFDVIVIEGAGSPAEVNLKKTDIVNMRIAKLAKAPVILITDIDRGGALASIVGTLELLDQEERDLVKGVIINKFRGDKSLLQPALDFLEQKTGKPVLGVLPYLDHLDIDDEDSVSLEDKGCCVQGDLEIAILRLPKISNFTDFDALGGEPDVSVRYVREGDVLGQPDLIILPGSKNTIEDLIYLKEQGYAAEISRLVAQGVPLIGICGGYQMLGQVIHDPECTESLYGSVDGLGLLPTETVFVKDKVTHQVKAKTAELKFLGIHQEFTDLTGYEIHMGRTTFKGKVHQPFVIEQRSDENVRELDGAVRSDGLVMGTYIHGIFDHNEYRRALLNALRQKKGLESMAVVYNRKQAKEAAYDRLAHMTRENLDLDKLYEIMKNC